MAENRTIPDISIKKLDSLFEAFSIVAEGTYVYLCDMKYDYSRWSKTAVDSFGLPSEYMYGAGDIWEKHIHPEDREAYHEGIEAIFSQRAVEHDMQYRARKADGEYDVCTCRGIVIKDENGIPAYFGGVIRNHSIQGHIDTMTGLRNQYGFFEDLRSYMIRQKKVRIVVMGIGRFTEINEVYGYDFGNRILQRFGRYLFEQVGNEGSVYKLDGTKFAVISNVSTAEEMERKYERIRNHFRQGFVLDGKTIVLELNAGILSLENFDVDEQIVYACLIFAYGESKIRKQGDIVEFYNDITKENMHRIEKLHAIRASITRGYTGFYLMYQPYVDADNECLRGAEALLRWRSDKFDMVPPDDFIPVLETDPLFPDLGQWILKSALTDALKMLDLHPDFTINVNLSYTQLEKPDFVDMVLNALDEVGYPASNLCLEITERCRLLDIDQLKNIVVRLRGYGIKIAMDDFGTGFSSVGILKDLPFDVIKIDRSFVMRIEEDDKERELMEHFASLASAFGAKVCVEGVETEGMKEILQRYRVQSFQGYYYAKPMEFTDFVKWEKSNA